MRIALNSLLHSASGPYGGRANHLKLSTTQDGQVLVTPRKRAMTGDHVLPVHAWARIHWMGVDAYWKTLPRRVRIEWGKCGRRTSDLAQSNLDQFRKVNMPRALLGFGLLRLPPDRFGSQAIYIPRPPGNPRPTRRPPMQVWLAGQEKPEPPWKPGDPQEPSAHTWPEPGSQRAFGHFDADAPNIVVPTPFCWPSTCPTSISHCPLYLYNWHPTAYEPRAGKNFFRWATPQAPDMTHEEPYYRILNEIWSERIWYGDEPYKKMLASDLKCYSGTWEDIPIPWPGAWCVKLTHWSAPAVELSYAWYWQPRLTPCPGGTFSLAKKEDVHHYYDWPPFIVLQPVGIPPDQIKPCPLPGDIEDAPRWATTHWEHLSNPAYRAGITWQFAASGNAFPFERYCFTLGMTHLSDLQCNHSGPLKGHYSFTLTMSVAHHEYPLVYAKANHHLFYGPLGWYVLQNEGPERDWASPTLLIWDENVDWNEEDPNSNRHVYYRVAQMIALAFLSRIIALKVGDVRALREAQRYYAWDATQKAASASLEVAEMFAENEWRCSMIAAGHYGPPIKIGCALATEAARRMKMLANAAEKLVPY